METLETKPGPWRITGSGWLQPSRRMPSSNWDERPPGVAVELLVIHSISLPPGQFGGVHIDELFCNRLDPGCHPYFAEISSLRVSAHLLIDRAGRVTQYVPFTKRAWHAGKSAYDGRESCNDFSIGIELEGAEEIPYEPVQYRTSAAVVVTLRRHYPSLRGGPIVGHSDIAPGRKTDPGKSFDWQRLMDEVAAQE